MSLLEKLESKKAAGNSPGEQTKHQSLSPTGRDPYADLKAHWHKKVIAELKEIPAEDKENNEVLSKRIEQLVEQFIIEEGNSHIPRLDRLRIAGEIVDEITGYGPITPLLRDPDISEVMVNGPNQVYVEKNGRLTLTEVFFRDDDHVLQIIERIVAPIGRRIDESMPMVDARLPDGSRVNAIIPPLALNGPTITIRKFSRDPFTVDDLVGFGTMTAEMAQFLEACVKARLNIVVSGGTGSGKTTTLNVLSSFIPSTERIITIEDAAELQLRQPHVLTLESRPPNIEGKGAITIRDLVRNSLRMRPDRIVVGEVRSGEALDMLQAMNTGHDGSLTTGHANSPRDMLSRLETMVMMAGMDLPVRAIREQIASAIDLIIQQSRLRDGSRRITHLTEVQGMEGDVIVLQDLYNFHQTGVEPDGTVKGHFQSTGIRPKFIDRLEASGIKLPPELFQPSIF
ncbi:pilus assembly protein CpaF [Desulfohalotomaculum tongense]|uniref:CpaF family protein n=1 Tax=Desulforadius tongensis TaxID=1216062 RepID=UPI00195BFC45|nr:CpaF family protein [Desulforadius tongensis]MBM7855621.1 pilus assembly protein CpaF [Desulforadius tongensis]